tara:strand:- start:4999 stop:5328 length:330 start_codon:yes stop_codon:yes gene_type:complete
MNRREKKKLRINYLRKIDNALKQERTKKKVEPNLDHIELLEKLKRLTKDVDHELYYSLKNKFPKSLSYIEKKPTHHSFWQPNYSFPEEMEKLFGDNLVQREIAFKQLGI